LFILKYFRTRKYYACLLKDLGKHYIKARVDRFKLGEVLNGRSIQMVVATHLIDVPI
jgi:hypothetical protein